MDNSSPSYFAFIPRIAKGAGIVFAGSIASYGLRYLFYLIIARQIGAGDFGVFSIAIAIFSIAEVLASLGSTKGIVRFVALFHREGDYRRLKGIVHLSLALVILGGVVIGLLLVILAEPLSINLFHAPKLKRIIQVMALVIPFSALTTVFISATQGLQLMQYKVYVRDLFEQLFKVTFLGVFFLFGWQLWGAVFAFIGAMVGGSLLSFYFYRRVYHSRLKVGIKAIFESERLMKYSWPLLFANGLIFFEAWIALFLIGFFSTTEATGVFSAAYRTSLLFQGILMSFNLMFSPIISDLHHKKEFQKLHSLFKIVTKWVFSLSLPFILIMVIFAEEFITIFGKDFAGGAWVLIILSLAQLLNSVTGPQGVMIDMSGRTKLTLFNAAAHLLLQVVLCFLLIPSFGIIGAAFAKLISIAFLRLLQLSQIYRFLQMHPFRADFVKPLIAGSSSFVVLILAKVSIIPLYNPILLVLGGSLILLSVYGLILFALGITDEDRLVFQKIKSRLSFS